MRSPRDVRLELSATGGDLDDAALRRALEAAGIRLDSQAEAAVSAWTRVAAREAVDNQPARAGYALSPRSTRGATRA